MKKLLVTGSSGLIGSEVCKYFSDKGWQIHGIDNNQRAIFFGAAGDTRWNQKRLEKTLSHFCHHELDIRDKHKTIAIIKKIRPDAIVHTAAQPSHDKAAEIPFQDFETNANGTLHLLEAARQWCPEAPFIHMSTNKVYGDAPNKIPMTELATRWDYQSGQFDNGIPETFQIDQSMHSLFGASKLAADIMVQEYGRYFNMPTCCLRGGCLTGPNHSGVELHGFLSYLIKCNIDRKKYSIFGYQGKQVRDNIHAYDVASFMDAFITSPRNGEVYNLGGGKENTCSILEAFELVKNFTNIPMNYEYKDTHRAGDHICYYSDLRKIKKHYPTWNITKPLPTIFKEISEHWMKHLMKLQL